MPQQKLQVPMSKNGGSQKEYLLPQDRIRPSLIASICDKGYRSTRNANCTSKDALQESDADGLLYCGCCSED